VFFSNKAALSSQIPMLPSQNISKYEMKRDAEGIFVAYQQDTILTSTTATLSTIDKLVIFLVNSGER
jgi:hypothetical protein